MYASLLSVGHRMSSLEYLAIGTFDVYKTLSDSSLKTLVVGKVKDELQLALLRNNSTLTSLEVGNRVETTQLSTGFLALMYMPLQNLVLHRALAFREDDGRRAPLRSVDIEFTAPLFLSRLQATLLSLTIHSHQTNGQLDAAIGECGALTTLHLLDGNLSFESLAFLGTKLHHLQRLNIGGPGCCKLPLYPYHTTIPTADLCLHFEPTLSRENHFPTLRCFRWSNTFGATLYLNADTNERFRHQLRTAAHLTASHHKRPSIAHATLVIIIVLYNIQLRQTSTQVISAAERCRHDEPVSL